MTPQPAPTPIIDRLTITSLSSMVAADLGLDPKEGYRLVTAVFDTIARAAVAGHDVAITNFGTWISYRTPAATRRNPQTYEPVSIPERQNVRFRTAPAFTAAVHSQNTGFTIRKTGTSRKRPAPAAE
jgi:nucleoid DNA-binding protein